MNSLESLWDILKDEIHKVPITNNILHVECLIHMWFHSEKNKVMCGSLICGMSRRVAALKQAKGGQTKYKNCFLLFS